VRQVDLGEFHKADGRRDLPVAADLTEALP
jgi:hypothetical protein